MSCPYTEDGMTNVQTFGGCYMTAIFDPNVEPILSRDTDGNVQFIFYYIFKSFIFIEFVELFC